jgi:hypothetical protein
MGDHENCLQVPEFTRYVEQQAGYQRAQNGSIGRIENGVNELRREIGEVHKTQLEITNNLLTTIDNEVTRRERDDHNLTERMDGMDTAAGKTEKRLTSLELIFKVPSWTWKALFGLATFLGVLFTILALTHVI